METQKTLLESLALERIELNLFRGTSSQTFGRLFGGHVIAQSLLAAFETLEGRLCHSLHCYFIHPGDARAPILYEVDRARDGGSFSTRRVIAIQNGRQIFNFAGSFQLEEEGFEHQAQMPVADDPETLPQFFRAPRNDAKGATEQMRAIATRPNAIDIRALTAAAIPAEGAAARQGGAWLRATTEIGADPRMQQAVLAYSSDMTLLSTAMRPHALDWHTLGLQSASLDHAMWFHRRSNFNDWHLYSQDTPSGSGGRSLVRGSMFSRTGTLVASVAQEVLVRVRKRDPG